MRNYIYIAVWIFKKYILFLQVPCAAVFNTKSKNILKNKQKSSEMDNILNFNNFTSYYVTPPSSPETELCGPSIQRKCPFCYHQTTNESQASSIYEEKKYQTKGALSQVRLCIVLNYFVLIMYSINLYFYNEK